MSNTFFTSDLHLGHANIIKYCNRPFTSVDEMNRAIINNWNVKVGPEDTTYILGDVAFASEAQAERMIHELNGHKILIWGNHDKVIRKAPNIKSLFDETHNLLERSFTHSGESHLIVMCHYAMRVWNKSHRGAIHLYGHSHGSLPDAGDRSMDVGIDTNNMFVYSLDDVIRKVGRREVGVVDHHGK